MAEQRTIKERLLNRAFAVPAITQWWARRNATAAAALVNKGGATPLARLTRPFAECTAALVTTAGVHLKEQTPFDMENPDGDASFRELPTETPLAALTITHKYYDHRDADADINVVFPLQRFRELVEQRVIGRLAPRHFGLMGHIDGAQTTKLIETSAPEIAAKLQADGVDFAFLTPA